MNLNTLANLIGSMSVVVVVAYMLTRSRMYEAIIENRMTWKHKVWIVILFGLFSIYGTISGVEVFNAIANIRDLGPAIAGLIGGPLVGVLAGLIGAIHRYYQGGFTAESCSLSTVLAGLFAGLYYMVRKGSFPSIRACVIFMICIELLHMGLTLLIAKPFDGALFLVKKIIVPMVVANAFGLGLFAFMIKNLKKEKAVESAKHIIEGELKAARDIQMSILPKIFPPFPKRTEFDLYAIIEPAKEVGGDFYDFFFVDENRLCFVIGDVSGKGVPASLFMAVTKTLIKARVLNGLAPDEALSDINDELARDNDSAMFVTVFLAILDVRTGEISYANGGHNPPYVVTSGDAVVAVNSEPGPVVGAIEDISYSSQSLRIQPGDRFYLYTDGVSEAMDKAQSFFNTDRLEADLLTVVNLPVKEGIEAVLRSVKAFCNGADQSDDITMMMINFRGTTSSSPDA
jgi:sigma-B regulation protein RsbU (phosphoserine phosphatase)